MNNRTATAEQRVLIDVRLANGTRFFWTGPGARLIDGSGVSAVLRDVAAMGAQVLRLEGFELEGTSIRPRLDLNFDAGRRPEISDPLIALREWPEDVWIDVTIRLPQPPAGN